MKVMLLRGLAVLALVTLAALAAWLSDSAQAIPNCCGETPAIVPAGSDIPHEHSTADSVHVPTANKAVTFPVSPTRAADGTAPQNPDATLHQHVAARNFGGFSVIREPYGSAGNVFDNLTLRYDDVDAFDRGHGFIDEDGYGFDQGTNAIVRYKFDANLPNPGGDLNPRKRIREAFGELAVTGVANSGWGKIQASDPRLVTGLAFREVTSGNAEIRIRWAATEADGTTPLGAVGLTQSPGGEGSTSGDRIVIITFNSGKPWEYRRNPGDTSDAEFHFLTTALHEIGHAVGLDEQRDFDDVMYFKQSKGCAGTVQFSGKATGGDGWSLQDTTKTRDWVADEFKDDFVRITSGTGAQGWGQIGSNDKDTLNLSSRASWPPAPDGTSQYEIVDGSSALPCFDRIDADSQAGATELYTIPAPDFGDAPAPYPTDLKKFSTADPKKDGARAPTISFEWMGPHNSGVATTTRERRPQATDTGDDGCQVTPDTGSHFLQGGSGKVKLTVSILGEDDDRYKNGNLLRVAVWADWNQDKDWKTNELLLNVAGGVDTLDPANPSSWVAVAGTSNHSFTREYSFDVPGNAKLGDTYVRCRLVRGKAAAVIYLKGDTGDESLVPLAASLDNGGEIEDYKVTVNAGDPDPEEQQGPCASPSADQLLDAFNESTAQVEIEIVNPAEMEGTYKAEVSGRTCVLRDAVAGDANNNGLDDLRTEIVQMHLTGLITPGDIPVTIIESPFNASTGLVEDRASQPADGKVECDVAPPAPCDSFFDVFVYVYVGEPPFLVMHNTEPLVMKAKINRLPPELGVDYTNDNEPPLVDEDKKVIGFLRSETHSPGEAKRRNLKLPPLQNVWLTRQGDKIPPARCEDGLDIALISHRLSAPITDPDPKDPTQVQQLAAFEFEVHFDETKVCVNLTEGSAWTAAGAVCIIEDKDSSQLEGVARIGCVTVGKGHEIDETQPLATIQVRPQPEVYSQAKPNQDNGVVVQINNLNCDLSDEQGHPIPKLSCDDADITFRYLEGDVNPDCVVDAADAQTIAFRWGVEKGSLIYKDFLNLEPSGAQADDDIDINDLQFVFGRMGSTCADPHPPQLPVNPKV
ncbi:MAG: matrixin family metalloprotease [Chloroflexi bacterium]|nr:matrixin family metalloprotease [Chloroflexota bacterium]